MLAIDTNLVVRYLVGDDRDQAAKARLLIDNSDVFVCTTVVLETAWESAGLDAAWGGFCRRPASGAADGCDAFITFDQEFARSELGGIKVRAP